MIQADNLDFSSVSKIINHPPPLLSGDGANKDYCDPILALYKAEYIMPLGSSVSVVSNTLVPMTDFTVPTSPTRNNLLYKINLNFRFTTAVVNRTANIVITNVTTSTPFLVRSFFLRNVGVVFTRDIECWVTAGSGETFSVYWSTSVAGSTITNTSTENQLSSFSIMGFPNSLFSLT